ncbi:unnamed protein product, partial [Allacma fusca]
RDLGV